MKGERTLRNSNFVFWGIIIISFICMVIAANLLVGCTGECSADLVNIVQSYPAEHSYHRIDLNDPGMSYATFW